MLTRARVQPLSQVKSGGTIILWQVEVEVEVVEE